MLLNEFFKYILSLVPRFFLFLLKPVIGVKTQAEVMGCEVIGIIRRGRLGPVMDLVKIDVEFKTANEKYIRASGICEMHSFQTTTLEHYLDGSFADYNLREQKILMLPVYYNRLNPKQVNFEENAVNEIENYKKSINESTPQHNVDVSRVVNRNFLFLLDSGKKAKIRVLDSTITEKKEKEGVRVDLEAEIVSGSIRGRILKSSILTEEKFIPYLDSGRMLDIYHEPDCLNVFAIVIPRNVKMTA